MNTQKSDKANQSKRSNKKVYVVLGITLGALSLAGLGYWYFKNKREDVNELEESNIPEHKVEETSIPAIQQPKISAPKTSTPTSKFPIKYGSKGELVKQIQTELIKKYGAQIMPKYGADGYYGKEMETALTSKGFAKVIDVAEYNRILALNTTTTPVTNTASAAITTDTKIDIAKNVWLYASTKNLTKLLEQLKRIKTVEDYKGVNELFKTIRLNGIRQTIVNGTLSSFSDATSKQIIRAEFLRMGLKYDGAQWSLSGIPERRLITKMPTTIRSFSNAELDVPANTLLGVEVGKTGDRTTFKTINHELLTVPTKHIQYV